MDNAGGIKHGGTPQGVLGSRRLLSRDINYLRVVILVWPFVLLCIVGVGCVFSPSHRQLGLRCAALAIGALLLARERLLMIFAGLGFTLIQCAVALVVHPWSWTVFAVGVLTGIPILVADQYWRNPEFSYQLPKEYGAVDMLLSFASICGTLFLFWVISPYN